MLSAIIGVYKGVEDLKPLDLVHDAQVLQQVVHVLGAGASLVGHAARAVGARDVLACRDAVGPGAPEAATAGALWPAVALVS